MKKTSFLNATGNIDYNMTNDYMFRVILQENKIALKGLLCALLRLKPTDINSVTITNPIKPGETIDMKSFYLDINLVLNNNTVINLEMQVANEYNWPDRSLSYICRSFVDMYKGQEYAEAKLVMHIGFLDYTLFKDSPEFYATYKIMNVLSHKIFNDKFIIGVIDLGRIDMATDEDRKYELDKWVQLFKAKTWEELKMIVENKPELLEASQSLYEYNGDLQVRQQCIAFEDYMRNMRKIESLEDRNVKLKEDIGKLESENEKLESENKKLESKNEKLVSQIEQLMEELDFLRTHVGEMGANNDKHNI